MRVFKKSMIWLMLFCVFISVASNAMTRGIYITQSNAENAAKMQYYIQNAKKFGIDTFVIDVEQPGKRYAKNISLVLANNIHYVARVVVFPKGGSHAQVTDRRIWEKRLALAHYAIQLGAKTIQLDYIRYRALPYASVEKAKRIAEVVKYFKQNLNDKKVELQMDIFGIASHKPAHTIGQDVRILAHSVDAFCPMVYPSHYEPFRHHAVRPYETVFESLTALQNQLKPNLNVDIYAYIELHNYRYPLSTEAKKRYILSEIKAVKDAGVKGWYAWSPNNHYKLLFQVLNAEKKE